jgi:uncharacterized protein YjbI with pentapeptide repeats
MKRNVGVRGGSFWLSWALGITGAALILAAFVPWLRVFESIDGASSVRLVLIVVAIASLIASFRVRPVYYSSPEMPPGARSMGAISAWWMVVGAGAVVAAMWVTTSWLLDVVTQIPPGAGQATARLEAVRTGLAAAGGVGAATALMLAFRRQRHQEASSIGVEFDASEKRVTELYVKASEQLGSDKAAVRMAGVFSLERLAQGNLEHRQTIVDLICAYLRMPHASGSPEGLIEEEQVRRAAQSVLHRHLRIPPSAPSAYVENQLWEAIDLDLTGASLFDWNFHGCTARHAKFIRTKFNGESFFGDASFAGFAVFGGAVFEQSAWFANTIFRGDAWFVDVTFLGDALFDKAEFRADASFSKSSFQAGVCLDAAMFRRGAEFEDATTLTSRTDIRLPDGWKAEKIGIIVREMLAPFGQP